MQDINQHNYEAYFLDYLEGNLTAGQEQELHLFLSKHPDLKAEVEETKLLYLETQNTTAFDAKNKLYRNEETALLQEEYLCIAAAEGVLTSKELIEFNKLMLERSERLADLAYYQKSRLKAPSITFPDKEKLKRRVLPLRAWKTYISAAAAAVLAIFLINSPQVEQSYDPHNLSLQLPTENLDETDLLSSKLYVRESTSELQPQKQTTKVEGQTPKQNLIENHLAELAEQESVKLKAMESMPLQEISRKPQLAQKARKIEKLATKQTFLSQSGTEELPTAMEFAKDLVKKELLKNQTLAELLLAEAGRLGEEKLSLQVEKAEREDAQYFAINIGKFSFSRTK